MTMYRIAGNFHEHKFLRITNKHARKNISWFLFSRQGHDVWPHPLQFPAWKWWPTACIFNVKTIVRFPSMSVAVGEKLPYEMEGANSKDLFTVAASWSQVTKNFRGLLDASMTTFCRFTGSAARRHCAQLVVSKKFLEEQIFMKWCLITKIAKISTLQKFPTWNRKSRRIAVKVKNCTV